MVMNLEFVFNFMLCLTVCFALKDDEDSNQATDLQKDIQDYIRRLTQEVPSSHELGLTGLLPQMVRLKPKTDGSASEDEAAQALPRYPFPRTSSYALATAKRPTEGDVKAESAVYSSVKEVNIEESPDSLQKIGTSTSEADKKISSTLAKDTPDSEVQTMLGKNGPTTLKHQQSEIIFKEDSFDDIYFVAIVAGCCAAAIFGVISAGFCFYRLQKSSKAAAEVDYPAYGVTGPSKESQSSPNGDRKLAQSAQMYHYQHQKQQMIAVEKAGSTKNTSASDLDSEEENEEGQYTVYECPGLAPTEEMEVKNPLFHDDATPVTLPAKTQNHN